VVGKVCAPPSYTRSSQHGGWVSAELALGWGKKSFRQFVNNRVEDGLFLICFKISRSSFFAGASCSSDLSKSKEVTARSSGSLMQDKYFNL